MSGCNDDPSVAACIEAIVTGDDFCGCHEWDGLCVETATVVCDACANVFD